MRIGGCRRKFRKLRALKLSSTQFFMQMAPPTTLTMCTSCERVAAPRNPPSTTVDLRSHHLAKNHHRPIPLAVGLQPPRSWAHRPSDALRPRS
ncbi:homeobox-leucine zipper protein HAT4-like isoform 2 [Hibiscus syriacus]|uniref:Homeobox-leucine zipper protein HAT4-like isoform 2 n=1 Tax=Hibiscus syriacus TaxID=106335 RepID=A0A6A3AVE9_HIBSY|nr:homeobox-leucine zipper protein HAT4-like isoform 2 [Hibiscus syriacus]